MSPVAACLAGSALILLTALARPLLLRLLPKWALPALWLTAALLLWFALRYARCLRVFRRARRC